ncbi:MAG: c-type cytochrome [Caulobacteraceae bacterium]
MKGHAPLKFGLVAATALIAASAAQAQGAGDATHGKTIFNEQCGLCHAVSATADPGAGPMLHGVIGHPAGTNDAKFAYTDAIKKSGLTWDEGNINKLLTDPNKLIPGTSMPISLPSAKDRDDMYAYLASLK